MVNFIKRDKDDIYAMPVIGFLFKNQKFIMALKIVVASLFFYAIYFGFTHTGKDNTFTWAVFWGIFWSLFMVVTLPSLGRVFCGICPHGFLGKYITKFGLKKKMPKWMQNQYIGVFLIVVGWWGIYYMFPGIYRTPFGTAMLFSVMTLLAFLLYFIYRDMSYCKYICPIGTLTRAYSKLSFTWLGSYKSACNECKTFECATACQHNLKPFSFDGRNSMTDCTLCMDCSAACEAISFKVKKPSFSLFKKFQILKAEVWTYILILAAIPISMAFHHGIGRSKVADEMIWSQTAHYFEKFIDFGPIDPVGLFAFLYAIVMSVAAAAIGMFIASKILQKDFKKIFYDLGYSYAPLFILGSLAHTLEGFFTRGADRIAEGFAYGFGFGKLDFASLASRGDSWLHIFALFKWIAVIWALIILYKRLKLIDAPKMRKILAFPFAASLIIFFLSVNAYRGYILDTYGRASGGMHGMHGSNAKVFQSVDPKQATILQDGEKKNLCSNCGMSLAKYYKVNHAATHNTDTKQFCSIHCLAEAKSIKHTQLSNIQVVDTQNKNFINAKDAYYVLGSKIRGVMTRTSKFAFASKEDALHFITQNGGKIVDFNTAYTNALKDFTHSKITTTVTPEDTLFFSDKKPSKRSGMNHGGMHMMHSSRDRSKVRTKSIYLVTGELEHPKCVENIDGTFLATDADNNLVEPKIIKKECTSIKFEMPQNGFYTTYYIQDDPKILNIAKYEYKYLDHSSTAKYDPKKMSAKTLQALEFDILRLRDKDESFYSRLHSKQIVHFKVLKDSKPLSGAQVTLTTQFGWQKTVLSNKEGIATFQLIQDYNPPWDKFNKRFREKFLITATYTGEKNYKISYANTFTPAREAYQSYSYGLIITLIFLTLLSGAIFLYRYKTTKPFKEVRFDE